MEHEYWRALDEIAGREGRDRAEIVQAVNLGRGDEKLVVVLRRFCILYFWRAANSRRQSTDDAEGRSAPPLMTIADVIGKVLAPKDPCAN